MCFTLVLFRKLHQANCNALGSSTFNWENAQALGLAAVSILYSGFFIQASVCSNPACLNQGGISFCRYLNPCILFEYY
jgi:hypothetical protein